MVNFYINLSKEQTSTFDLSNVDVDKLYLFNTNPDDLIVPYSDAEYIYNAATGISDGDKDIIPFNFPLINKVVNAHFLIDNSDETINKIKDGLKK